MALTYLNRNRNVWWWNPSTGAWVPDGTFASSGVASEETKPPVVKGTKTGTWRNPTGYTRLVRRFSGAEVDMLFEQRYLNQTVNRYMIKGAWNHNQSGSYPSLPAFPANLRGRAVNEALNSLKGQKLNLAVAFGERKETARFVGETLQDAVGLMRALRKKDVKALYQRLKSRRKRQRYAKDALEKAISAPSQLVLKNSYALGPLLQDIYGGVELLNEKDLADPKRYGVSVKKFVREKIDSETLYSHGVNNLTCFAVRQDSGLHGCMVRLDYYLENPLLRTLTQLGVTNPAELAWELIPFSFVADWVLPIGSYLGALDATLGLQFRSGSRSELTRVHHKLIPLQTFTPSAGWSGKIFTNFVKGTGKQVKLDRIIYDSSPSPVFPSFKNPASLSHALNALSLVQQLLKS